MSERLTLRSLNWLSKISPLLLFYLYWLAKKIRSVISLVNVWDIHVYLLLRMRSSLVVRASDCQCTSCNGPGFDPSIRRHSGILGAADEAVLNIVQKNRKNPPKKLTINVPLFKKLRDIIFLGGRITL